jgi:hypothetical protein
MAFTRRPIAFGALLAVVASGIAIAQTTPANTVRKG